MKKTLSIKAIETEYNGYKFRSRLEARWAHFFDKMGIELATSHNTSINDVFESSLDTMNTRVDFVYAPLLKSYTLKYRHDIYFQYELKNSLKEAKQARFEFDKLK